MVSFFFFNHPATTEIYTLSLHDALPIFQDPNWEFTCGVFHYWWWNKAILRSEEHTSELQSLRHLVCRLLLEKKKNSIAQAIATRIVVVQVKILGDSKD